MAARTLVMLLLCLLISASCSKKNPILIGSLGGLSGRYSELGVSGRNAVDMAIEEQNAAGGVRGRRLILVTKDDRNSPEACKISLEEFIQEGVHFVIGPYTSNMADTVLAAIKNNDVLVISPTISTDTATGIDDNFLRTMGSNKQKANNIASIILDKGHKKIAVTYDVRNAAFSETLYLQFAKRIKILSPESVVVGLPLNDGLHTFPEIVKEIKNSHSTALFSITAGIDGAKLCQQLMKHEADVEVYGAIWMMTNELLTHGGESVEGVRFVGKYEPEKKTERYISFQDRYKRRYNREPSMSSYYAYESTQILLSALKDAESLSVTDLKKEILSTADYEGLLETISFDAYGDVQRGASTIIVKEGAFILDR